MHKVLIVVPCFGYGGMERVVISLLDRLERTRFDPALCILDFQLPEVVEKARDLGIRVHSFRKGEGISLLLPFELAALLLREKIDVVNSHDVGATLYAAAAALMVGGTPVVHTEHSQILTKQKHLKTFGWMLKNLVKHSVSVSDDLKRHLVRTIGLDALAVTTIPNGIDMQQFGGFRDVRNLREALGIRDEALVVGTIGRLTEQKGMQYLLEAFSRLVGKRQDLQLVIVGDGPMRNSLAEVSLNLGIGDRVLFLGNREDVPELLALFDLFVLPSLWEGQPITLIEAMAAGKPIVATAVGGNREILREGTYGLLVPPADAAQLEVAIESLLRDRVWAGDLGCKAQAYARDALNQEKMVKEYERIFSTVLRS